MALACLAFLLIAASDSTERARTEIIAAYNASLDALRRGDADGALRYDTSDWVSITVGERPRSRAELEPLIRRDIGSMKPPADWSAVWRPGYELNGAITGIQIYDFKVEGDRATVLCLVGSTRMRTIDGAARQIWQGSHVRDTWIKTPSGWKRRMHEKLTVNEQLIDGRPPRAGVTIPAP
jgi:hypothetical protein